MPQMLASEPFSTLQGGVETGGESGDKTFSTTTPYRGVGGWWRWLATRWRWQMIVGRSQPFAAAAEFASGARTWGTSGKLTR